MYDIATIMVILSYIPSQYDVGLPAVSVAVEEASADTSQLGRTVHTLVKAKGNWRMQNMERVLVYKYIHLPFS